MAEEFENNDEYGIQDAEIEMHTRAVSPYKNVEAELALQIISIVKDGNGQIRQEKIAEAVSLMVSVMSASCYAKADTALFFYNTVGEISKYDKTGDICVKLIEADLFKTVYNGMNFFVNSGYSSEKISNLNAYNFDIFSSEFHPMYINGMLGGKKSVIEDMAFPDRFLNIFFRATRALYLKDLKTASTLAEVLKQASVGSENQSKIQATYTAIVNEINEKFSSEIKKIYDFVDDAGQKRVQAFILEKLNDHEGDEPRVAGGAVGSDSIQEIVRLVLDGISAQTKEDIDQETLYQFAEIVKKSDAPMVEKMNELGYATADIKSALEGLSSLISNATQTPIDEKELAYRMSNAVSEDLKSFLDEKISGLRPTNGETEQSEQPQKNGFDVFDMEDETVDKDTVRPDEEKIIHSISTAIIAFLSEKFSTLQEQVAPEMYGENSNETLWIKEKISELLIATKNNDEGEASRQSISEELGKIAELVSALSTKFDAISATIAEAPRTVEKNSGAVAVEDDYIPEPVASIEDEDDYIPEPVASIEDEDDYVPELRDNKQETSTYPKEDLSEINQKILKDALDEFYYDRIQPVSIEISSTKELVAGLQEKVSQTGAVSDEEQATSMTMVVREVSDLKEMLGVAISTMRELRAENENLRNSVMQLSDTTKNILGTVGYLKTELDKEFEAAENYRLSLEENQ